MKSVITFLVIILFTPILQAQSNDYPELNISDYRWENRLLLIFSLDKEQAEYVEFMSRLRDEWRGVAERDLKIISVFRNSKSVIDEKKLAESSSEVIKGRYNSNNLDFRIVLIGKDGGSKMVRDEIITVGELFRVIDRMPMRRQEMRQN
jgi:hypothetical protein